MKIWTFIYGWFFAVSAIHIESMVLSFTWPKVDIKWLCFSILLIPFINRQKLNKKLLKSSEFDYFFSHIIVSTVLCSVQFRQVHHLQPWMSVPKGGRFKQICLVFDQAYSHSCAGPCGKDLNINIISGKTNPLHWQIWGQSHWQPEINSLHSACWVQSCLLVWANETLWYSRDLRITTIFISDTKKVKCTTEVGKGRTVNQTQNEKLRLLIPCCVLNLPDHTGLTQMGFRWASLFAVPQSNIKDYASCYSGCSSVQESQGTEATSEFHWILIHGGKRLEGEKAQQFASIEMQDNLFIFLCLCLCISPFSLSSSSQYKTFPILFMAHSTRAP